MFIFNNDMIIHSIKSIRKRRGSYNFLLVGWNCDVSPSSTFPDEMSFRFGEGISLLKDGGCHDTSPSADEFRWFQFTIMILELKSPPIHQTNGPRCTQAPHFGIFVPLQHLNKLKLCTTSPATRRTKSYDQSGTCRWTTCAVGISGYRWTMVNWWTDQVTVEQSTLWSKLRLKRTLWTRGWKLPRLWNLPLGFCRCGTESCPLTALFAPFESRNQGHKWP